MTVAETLRRKVIGVPITKAASSEDGGLLVLGKFTSDQKDEAGDIITRSATERALPKYKRWGNIRRMHLPQPVGRVTRIGVEDGLDWNEVEIKVIDPQAKFEVENGLLQALSVGILVNFADVNTLEDGGWVINDYMLAEISLVDHPANYDAALETLNLSLDAQLRSQIREQGVVPVLRSIGMFPAQEGEPMDKELEGTTPVADEVIVDAQPDVEKTLAVEEEAPAAEAAVEEQPVAEVEPVVEEVPAEEAHVSQDTAVQVDGLAQLFSSLTGAIEALSAKFDSFVAQNQDAPAPAADVESETAKDISGDGDRVAQLEKQVADLTAKLEAISVPVDRKGALPVEEPAEEVAVESDQVERALKPASLRAAVGKYLETKARK